MSIKPKTEKEAYENGLRCHTESQNPFRNMGVEYYKLNNEWYKGFEFSLQRTCSQCKEVI